MTVYVDDYRAPYRGMKMCHMLADTDDELHAMADKIGISRRHHQNGMSGSHYDIASSKALLAIRNGAIPITVRQAAMMTKHRRKTGALGQPDPYFGRTYDPSAPYPGDDPRAGLIVIDDIGPLLRREP
jgi:hypothetical protein